MNTFRFNDAKADRIFYDTLWSFESSCDRTTVVREVDSLRDQHPEGNLRSNYGGWQSPVFEGFSELPTIGRLTEEISSFVNAMAEAEGMGVQVKELVGWANVNEKHSYNSAHRHGNGTDFIAVYYPRFPENSGPLAIVRDGGGALLCQNLYLPGGITVNLRGEENHVYVFSGHLLHFVHPHPTDELRYSLSFNISCAPK